MSSDQPFNEVDPFTQVYRRLWKQLKAEDDFVQLVPRGNRIEYDGDARNPDKDQRATADYPQVRIRPQGGAVGIVTSSTGSTVEKRFNIEMQTGDLRLTEILFPLEWSVLKAFSGTKAGNLDLSFVENVEIEATNSSDRDPQDDQMQQWVGLWIARVRMNFNTADDLQAA